MKPAWPRENWPVNPVIRLRLTASTMLMQIGGDRDLHVGVDHAGLHEQQHDDVGEDQRRPQGERLADEGVLHHTFSRTFLPSRPVGLKISTRIRMPNTTASV